MSHYGQFAEVYDLLTSEIDYPARAAYFDRLIHQFGGFRGILLDLGCGTGSLAEEMAALGYDVIGVDNSEDMLWVAQQKRMESGHDITYICQEMTELDLYGTIDAVVSALDSLNHLTDYADFCKAIAKAALFLHPDGVFVFDLNTCYKHREILANNTFVYDYDEVFCAWQNTLLEEYVVQMDLSIFVEAEDGLFERMEESFAERAYSPEQVERALQKAGLELCAVYDEDSVSPPRADSQRLIYVARHKK
ncbi:MAG: class I SAM-dependent DNA methyltransferase [Candidatus Merdivicinus sp.]|jgi:SAM-dependent methyltransferase